MIDEIPDLIDREALTIYLKDNFKKIVIDTINSIARQEIYKISQEIMLDNKKQINEMLLDNNFKNEIIKVCFESEPFRNYVKKLVEENKDGNKI